jgi:hypothetical protein
VALGTVHSVHRAKLTSVAWLVVLAVFCFGVVVATIAMPFGTPDGTTPLKRLGLGALFGAGGAVLVVYALSIARTRVELCADGFRHIRASVVEVPWDDIARVDAVRINGNLRTLIVYAREHRLAISAGLAGFDDLVAAVRDRAPRASSLPSARVVRRDA